LPENENKGQLCRRTWVRQNEHAAQNESGQKMKMKAMAEAAPG
jgi:hypothetical protein